jgi:superfamily I DNA/RNA helicase
MIDDSDAEIGRLAARLRRGSVVAAAGCGKTEQIARAVGFSDRRRLVLTHTHAGVEVLMKRFKKHRVPTDKYRIGTIAGWCLRFAAAFPAHSGVEVTVPNSTAEWDAIYSAAARLIDSGTVDGVIAASYGGCFVDEYQDCTRLQHEVIQRLANFLPTCIFGDPLQAIFDFRGQQPVDWESEVFPTFGQQAELVIPWRWKNAKNPKLAEWLKHMRQVLVGTGALDLTGRPACVSWIALPSDPNFQQAAIVRECLGSMDEAHLGDLIVIGDSRNVNGRSALARRLAQRGFSSIESINCKDLFDAAKLIDRSAGVSRFKALLHFASKCMTGTDKAELEKAVAARQQGRRLGQAKFGALFPLIDIIIETGAETAMLAFLQALRERLGAEIYRREMFFAMCSAMQMKATRQLTSLSDSVWEVQNRSRHAGRRLGNLSIGSTLLVKGLEFDRSIVMHANAMTRKDWYVALTRASQCMRIISPSISFMLPV